MFGTVTAGMIADQLKTQFDVTLDKRKIHLEHPIRTLGEHDVELRLHADVNATLKVRVESSNPLPAAPAAEADARKDVRTEKRGRRAEAAPEAAEADDKKARPAKGGKPEKAAKAAKGE